MNDDDKSVPPAQEEDRVIHECDGIQEYDNRLPRWWLYTLYGTLAFGAFYWSAYHVLKSDDLPRAAYEKQMASVRAKEAEKIKSQGAVTPEGLLALSKDPTTVSKGKDIFMANCVACHKADASGLIGPNLTDDHWIHGGKPNEIYKTVSEGVPAKGMLAWGPQLGQEKVQDVVAYVITLKNTNVPGGKPPQGDIVEP
jgi:cytochrome c oxidase cbb3-type subunit III